MPFLACVVFAGADWAYRDDPVEATVLLVMLLPLLALPAIPRACPLDAGPRMVLAIAVLLMLWMAGLQVLRDTAIPSGWWRICERAVACALFIAATALPFAAATGIWLLGLASAITAMLVVLSNRIHGYDGALQTTCFGFGHANIFANTVAPALWAACTLPICAPAWRARRRDLLLLLGGAVAVALLVLDTGRRGALLALVAVVAFHAWRWLWGRRPLAAVALAGLGLIALALPVQRLLTEPVPSLRNERIALYRAGFVTAMEGLPFGYGHYGALQLQHADNEPARHLTATGSWGTHIHSEPLDILLDGGPVALVLASVLAALTVWRVARIQVEPSRRAAQTLLVAVGVHMVTDNVYGTEYGQAWLGLALGLVWALPARPFPALRSWRQPTHRLLMWPFVLIACYAATRAIYPAVIHREAFPSIHVQSLRQALDPTSVQMRAVSALIEAEPAMDLGSQVETVAMAVAKMGWTLPTAVAEANARWRLDDPLARSEALLRVLDDNPFSRKVYELLGIHLANHPRTALPPRIRQRLAWLSGVPTASMPEVNSIDVRSVEAAADAYAMITCAIVLGRPWSEIVPALNALAARYGDVPDVATLVLRVFGEAPPAVAMPLLGRVEALRVGLRLGADVDVLAEVITPEHARRMEPLLRALHAERFAAWDAGRSPLLGEEDARSFQLLRLWQLARRRP